MKNGWETKQLGEVLQKTETVDPIRNPEKEFKYIDVSGVNNIGLHVETITTLKGKDAPSRARKLIKKNDIIFATVRPTLRRIAIIHEDLNNQVCSTGYFVLRANEKIYYKLLFYYLQLDEFNSQMEKLQRGASYPAVTDGDVRNQVISFPKSLPEQQRIVSILDEAFAAITKAKANTEKNLENAKELFESYLQNVFANPGTDWKERKLTEFCTLINGKAYSQKELLKVGKYPVLRVGNFYTNRGWYYSDLELPEDKYCENGDLLYAWSASFGPQIWRGEKVIYHYHIWKVIPRYELISREFLYLLLDWDTEKIKKDQGTGTTMMHVGKGSMEQRVLPLPPLSQQELIVLKVNKLLAQTKKLETIYQQKLNDLEELKKSILQKAFRGELKTKQEVLA